jgi:hypothetical protein
VHTTTPTLVRRARARRIRLATGGAILAVMMLAVACGNDDTDSSTDTTAPSPVAGPVDGDQLELTARIKEIYTASASIEFDELDILTGEEARQAAVEAGAIEPDEDLPNDVWLRDDSDATERATVDPGAVVWIYDCTGACERVQVELGAFLRHEIEPFGGDDAVWEITITDGMISSLLEVYLP